ncbi:MAG: HD domain-containing protein [Lachnospiraceae bacterium]|nr:HD domain-containing protein [Lachnospiraceae bacterium]
MGEKRNKSIVHSPMMKLFIILSCVLVNFFGKHFAVQAQLPLWLDSFGTVFAAYVVGPAAGAIVGCAGNVIYYLWDSTSIAYGITSVFIGVSLGIAARKKYFNTFLGATSVAGCVTIGSVFISAIINIIFYDGYTGNIWGDGVIDYLTMRGLPRGLNSFIGEAYLDFLDKLVTVLAMYFLVRMVRHMRSGKRGSEAGKAVTVFFLTLILGAGLILPAQAVKAEGDGEVTYIQRIYNADNGLPCGHANDVVQTPDGILWVGSYAGLYRYNGISFRFMNEFQSVKNVNCLYVDDYGLLWIGTNDNGVVLTNGSREISVLQTAQGLPSDSVRTIIQSTNGEYYVGTSDSMAVLGNEGGPHVLSVIPEIRYAQSITADDEGRVAAVTAEGSLFVLENGEIISEYDNSSGIQFASCTFSPGGLLYAGTTDGRVVIFSLSNRALNRTRTINCPGVSEINEICFCNDEIWVLADNGVGKLEDHKYQKISTGDFNSSVERMCADYQGNLWLASTRHGLLQLLESCFSNLNTDYGLDPAVVNTTAIRRGILYIGADSGITEVRLSDGNVLYDDLTAMLAGVRIRCIMRDSAENLWICSYGKGLIRVSGTGDILVYDQDTYGIGRRARTCVELSDGSIAVSADTGLSIIRNGSEVTTIPYGDELGSSQILSFCENSDGRLFIGTDGNGIVIFEDGQITGYISKEDGLGSGVILRMVYDEETDSIFVVTSNSLSILKGDEILRVTNFPYSNNYDIVLDDDGEAFVLGSAGIYVVSKEDLIRNSEMDYMLLNSRVGLRGALTANSWNELTASGDLFLSTDRGVVCFNLDNYKPENRDYRIMVSEVRLDGKPVLLLSDDILTIDTSVGTIEFIPEIVNYTLDDPRISYYLEGVDSGYKTVLQSEIGGAIYNNIPAGEYRFHLAIIDEETGAVYDETIYPFIKKKAIYDNDWFIYYMIFVGGLFIGWLTWFITRFALQKKMDRQQQKLALALRQVQMGNETIMAIAKTVDAKDTLTSQHSQRVSDYSVIIAKHIGFSEEEVENIKKAALLHDIGKIGIPDAILNKPAKLTDAEYQIMKRHVTKGAEILKDFTLVEHAAEGAKYHHERFDGTGYPEGLKGKKIPLYGRIIAIADAFDAMTANRVYRPRMDFEAVMEELRKGRGTQFDPELLDVFLKLIEDGDIDVESLYSDL